MRAIYNMIMQILFVLLLVLSVCANLDDEYESLLIQGDKLLMAGRSKYYDALSKYTAAIQLKESEKKAYYRRAELYSLLKDYKQCEKDIQQVLSIDPEHHQSIALRSKILSRRGDFVAAAADEAKLVLIFTKKKNSKKAQEALNRQNEFNHIGRSWANVQNDLENLPKSPKDIVDRKRIRSVNQQCVDVLKEILTHVKDSTTLRIKRVECAIVARLHQVSADELRIILSKDPSNLAATALNANSMRLLGAVEHAKNEIRRCLSLDPEHTACQRVHKAIKRQASHKEAIEAAMKEKKYDNALSLIAAALIDPGSTNEDELMRWRCEAFVGKRDTLKGVEACTEAIEIEGGKDSPAAIDCLLHRADLYFMNDENNNAEEDVNNAAKINSNHERVKEFQQRLENLKRGSNRKNYYKILGVPKRATSEEIRRAYRKLARKHHPDHYAKDITPSDREKQDKLFRDLNEAKEILLDDKKRERYDNGEDVANPQSSQPQTGSHTFFFNGGNFRFQFGHGFNFRFG